MTQPRLDFPALHGLRFILCLWVLGFHIVPILTDLAVINRFADVVLAQGYLAVDVFFVLSGFVITHRHGLALRHGAWPVYRNFLQRRVARLYPLHLLTLLLLGTGVIVAHLTGHAVHDENYTPTRFLANLLLAQSWTIPAHLNWNHPAWAISIEWLVYLLSPILLRAVYHPVIGQRVRQAVILLLLVYAFGIGFSTISPVRFAVLRGIGGFGAGIILYKIHQHRHLPRPAILNGLAAPVMQRLGDVSFAIYMLQYPLIMLTRHVWPPLAYQQHALIYLTGLLLLIFTAAVTAQRVVEEPARRWLTAR